MFVGKKCHFSSLSANLHTQLSPQLSPNHRSSSRPPPPIVLCFSLWNLSLKTYVISFFLLKTHNSSEMNIRSNSSLHLQSSFFQSQTPVFLHKNLHIRDFRAWKRRRLKADRNSATRSCLRPVISLSFENLFQNILHQFPSSSSLELIAPALGFTSGVALYFSRRKKETKTENSEFGEWVLVTSPTAFNRFVLLRCPSISIEEAELLESVSDNLLKQERHFVNLDIGKIQGVNLEKDGLGFEEKLMYQRVCISTDDGGVISLDWPAHLDLGKEQGLDTTLLLVPGTTEGSADRSIRSFVHESLKCGYFPVVMNPRGCAGSPLTTARLFTAADSDDICKAIQFINKARPWSTLMGIGWGYGANMLTKYLSEVAERTPLTAAACIDNPFDLEEATRSYPHQVALDEKLTGGLVEILRANKELFQGRSKGFNVTEGLSATCVRDFEKAISMIPYGFEAVEEFYSKSSTRQLIGNLKIPVFFIQSDDGTVPLFSVPRNSIAENPFTSLLLCSCCPSRTMTREKSVVRWCHHLVVEWLGAVELALLKGRHPLLKDVDITINPSKGLALVEGRASNQKISTGKDLSVNHDQTHNLRRYRSNTQLEALNGSFKNEMKNLDGESTVISNNNTDFQTEDMQGKPGTGSLKAQVVDNSVDLVKDEENLLDREKGHMKQTVEFVMKTLDVTMPGMLEDEQKKKVLTAVEQGETVMNALLEVVPEDVRGKLTSAVSEIMQTQGANLNLDKLGKIKWVPNVMPEGKSEVEENINENINSSDYMKTVVGTERNSSQGEITPDSQADKDGNLVPHSSDDELSISAGNNQSDSERSEQQPFLKPQKSVDSWMDSNNEDEVVGSGTKDSSEEKQSCERNEFSQGKSTQVSGYVESGSELGKTIYLKKTDMATDTNEVVAVQQNVNQSDGVDRQSADDQTMIKDGSDDQRNDEKYGEPTGVHSVSFSNSHCEESSSSVLSSAEDTKLEKGGSERHKDENKSVEVTNEDSSVNIQEPSPAPPPVSVSEALNALTGFDDSTQLAVNSVFGVIENMINQLEKEKNRDSDERQDQIEEQESNDVSEKSFTTNKDDSEKGNKGNNGFSTQSAVTRSNEDPGNIFPENCREAHQFVATQLDNGKPSQNFNPSFTNSIDRSQGNNPSVHQLENKFRRQDLTDSTSPVESSNLIRSVHSLPLHVTISPGHDSPYKESLHNCISSKLSDAKSLDLDSTTDLFLEYFPGEGQWRLLDQLEQSKSTGSQKGDNYDSQNAHSQPEDSDGVKIIEPSYVIIDDEYENESTEELEIVDEFIEKDKEAEEPITASDDLLFSVKNIVLDAVKVEVGRRLGVPDMKSMDPNLAHDLEQVAEAVALSVRHSKKCNESLGNENPTPTKFPAIHGQHIIETITSSVQETNHLRRALPVGVIVGSSLAALGGHFHVIMQDYSSNSDAVEGTNEIVVHNFCSQESKIKESFPKPNGKQDQFVELYGPSIRDIERPEIKSVMVGAVTAAVGASALLAHHKEKRDLRHLDNPEEAQERNQNNVASLAEKAMTVAAPVVPTKNDGVVDQDRLVAILADLGQKGGLLKFIGKIALLWGGIRGAISLTNRLITFLHIAERPLFQRIIAFSCMVLVLWSPVVVPLLPTLVQNWVAGNSTGVAEYVSIIGLYTAIMMLVMLWGKRIRGYEDPLEQYGLDLTSPPKLYNFFKGLMGGLMLVLSIHCINTLLGFTCLIWPLALPSSSEGTILWLKAFNRMFVLAARSIVPATCLAIVEELLFRSWLPEEIAADLGYHRAVIISALTFSLFQRSVYAVPGLLLLSFALAGAKEKANGKLSVPIGIRAGIMTGSFILQNSGILTYKSDAPFWVTGTHPFQPFGGAVGLALCTFLAITNFPRDPTGNKLTRIIRE